ncbi:MAG: aspartate aminotransferase family protein [Candidatus Brocadiales bacterium]
MHTKSVLVQENTTKAPGHIGPEEIVRKKERYLIPCVYHFYKRPMQIVRGEMQYLYDHAGRRYLDFYAGVSVTNTGHCNPEITEKVVKQLRTLQHTTSIYLTQPVVDLAERLADITPGNLQKTFFCASGSEANEGAVFLAQLFTKRSALLALSTGLHGHTKHALSFTGIPFWRIDPSPVGGVTFVPAPYCYRCPLGGVYPGCDLECVKEVERTIARSTSEFAAFIAEPVQGNGGIIVPPKEYFPRLKEILDRHGILLIVDEVQTGFGRTGKMFAIEHWGVEPDIMSLAKALGNGIPIGAFASRSDVASALTHPYASTWGGNPVAATSAIATLNYIERHSLAEQAHHLGLHLKKGLTGLSHRYNLIGDVRGLGLMVGVELVKGDKSPAQDETTFVLEHLKDHGVLVGRGGQNRNVLAFQPPLVLTEEDIDEMLDHLGDALQEAEKGR